MSTDPQDDGADGGSAGFADGAVLEACSFGPPSGPWSPFAGSADDR